MMEQTGRRGGQSIIQRTKGKSDSLLNIESTKQFHDDAIEFAESTITEGVKKLEI